MGSANLEALVAEVLAAAPTLEADAVDAACTNLINGLRASAKPLPGEAAGQVLAALRRQRHFRAMQLLADALIRFGCDEPLVWRHYAQALIDCGQLVPAIGLLEGLVRRTRERPEELAEALGLLGRAHKQVYVQAEGSRVGLGRKALRLGLEAYRKGFLLEGARRQWHGVNLLALLCRARRDGLKVEGGEEPEALARELIAAVEAKPAPLPWECATAGEAAVALKDWDAAERWMARYVAAPEVDAFALAGTLRQLGEVWGLVPGTSRPGQLMAVLSAALLRKANGRLELAPQQLSQLDAAGQGAFERVLGDTGTQTYTWLKRGLERARSIGLIRQGDGRGVGTGFLVRGGDLDPALGEEPLLLTNAHVVSDDPADQGLPARSVRVGFELDAQGPGAGHEPRRVQIVWTSPKAALDATLLRLDPPPDGVPVCPIAPALPPAEGERARVYVIGHPGGRELAFSLQDNRLLDHEGPPGGRPSLTGRVLLHYRAPTEPGSSGSPVFDPIDWEVVGLHHAGGDFVRRLNGGSGTYAANEGIWIQSIAAALRA